MSKYYLSNAAVEDLRSIMAYTLEEWGSQQVIDYRDRIEDKLVLLAEFPGMGRTNDNLPGHILYMVEGEHYVFYRVVNDGIEVIRLLHVHMDVFRHIRGDL